MNYNVYVLLGTIEDAQYKYALGNLDNVATGTPSGLPIDFD